MSQTPMISVIMSVYNGSRFIREAIDSILDQTFSDFEFLIFEDKSTDDTLQILESYSARDPRIKIIKKQENKGLPGFIENLNLGLKMSRGKYIARMDADDISHPDRFAKQLKFLEENPEIFMVGSTIKCIGETGNFLRMMQPKFSDKEIKNAMFSNIQMYHPVIMFRNTDEVQFREKMLYCEDYDLYFRLILAEKKFANIDLPLLKYRILDHSVTRKDSRFIKWLFVEKARQFFNENRQKGRDSYDDFKTDELLYILEPNFENAESELLFACKSALKHGCDAELQKILTKTKSQQLYSDKFRKYAFYLNLPQTLKKFTRKIFS